MKLKKTASITVLTAVAIFSLTACSSVTEADVNASTHRVMQTESKGLSFQWEYIDSTGNRIEMDKCKDSGFWSKMCVETPDGLVKFEWGTVKGSIVNETIFFDGAELETECTFVGGFWDSDNFCGAG